MVASGLIRIDNVPNGEQTILFNFVGYEPTELTIRFPLERDNPFEIFLEPSEEELEEVVVLSTRSSRTIADIPPRVEIIAGEEQEEKGNMKPGDIRMLLNECTGIQTQQTSATSANASLLSGIYLNIRYGIITLITKKILDKSKFLFIQAVYLDRDETLYLVLCALDYCLCRI